jgi:hypothetical protein
MEVLVFLRTNRVFHLRCPAHVLHSTAHFARELAPEATVDIGTERDNGLGDGDAVSAEGEADADGLMGLGDDATIRYQRARIKVLTKQLEQSKVRTVKQALYF